MIKGLKKILDADGRELSVKFTGHLGSRTQYEASFDAGIHTNGKSNIKTAFVYEDELDLTGSIPKCTRQLINIKASADILNDINKRAEEKAKAKAAEKSKTKKGTSTGSSSSKKKAESQDPLTAFSRLYSGA